MNEAAAREVILVRAVETTDVARAMWTDADRAWAGRAAAEVVGAAAPADVFLARRAALSVERLGARHPSVPRLARMYAWRPGVGVALVLVAFTVGVISDQIGAAGRINILAPPLLALIAWNLGAYIVLLGQMAARSVGGQRSESGPLRRIVAWLGRAVPRGTAPAMQGEPVAVASASAVASATAAASAKFSAEWAWAAAPLLGARISRILHFAAAALALGALTGLYVRGLAFEYRAGWESTFLDADTVARVLSFALAPGAWLTGIVIPGAEQLEGIRAPGRAGENAAPWIHLYAATVAIMVLLPRLLLGARAWVGERRATQHFPLPLSDPYYARLLRGFTEGPARVHVVPYSFDVPEASVASLRAVMARTFGTRTEVTLAPTVAYGDEQELAAGVLPSMPPSVLVGLFSLAATPESENHGAFIAALARAVTPGTQLAAIVDEASFRVRFAGQTTRVDERRAAWRQMLASHGIAPIFIDLAQPDLPAAEAALNAYVPRQHD
ncbi:MAG: DUF2868 domain-containing protein [Casimicrobiaceae bacterium]